MPQTPINIIQAMLDHGLPVQPTIVPLPRAFSPVPSANVGGAMRGGGLLSAHPPQAEALRAQHSAPGASPSAYDGLIQAAAARHRLDPNLLKAVARTESNFNPNAVSPAGAKGMMQIMDFNLPSLGVSNPFDPAQNIEGGAQMLRRLLDKYGDLPRALAAYNAGSGAVDRYGGVPPYRETQTYVTRVLDALRGYSEQTGTQPSAVNRQPAPVAQQAALRTLQSALPSPRLLAGRIA